MKYVVSFDFDFKIIQKSAAKFKKFYIKSLSVAHNLIKKLLIIKRLFTAYTSFVNLKKIFRLLFKVKYVFRIFIN